jgi:hypothetical protein
VLSVDRDVTPPERLSVELETYRERGFRFRVAWGDSVSKALRGDSPQSQMPEIGGAI